MKKYLQPLVVLVTRAEDDLIRTSGLNLSQSGSDLGMEGDWKLK